jgi:uncharacterized protein (DUF934 family)
MPKLIKLHDGRPEWADDIFVSLGDDEPAPTPQSDNVGAVIVSLARFQADGDAWLSSGRKVGVRLQPDEAVEGLAYDLPRLSLVALTFPKFRDGRAYSAATLLRERYGFTGEIRAVGEVLREQAHFMIRCGFDAYEPSDGSGPEEWGRSAYRFHHVYQAAADTRRPAYLERGGSGAAPSDDPKAPSGPVA